MVDGQAPGDDDRRRDPTGIYFGTTSGEVWGSRDEGRTFRCLARHLPHIYAVEVARDEACARLLNADVRHEVSDDGAFVAEAAAVVRVRIPSPLRSYTGAAEVGVAVPVLAPELPPTLGGVLAALDGAYPGIRFRIIDEQGDVRPPHQALRRQCADARPRHAAFPRATALMIVAALSGG